MPIYWLRWDLANFFAQAGLELCLPILASQKTRITSVSHWCLTESGFFKRYWPLWPNRFSPRSLLKQTKDVHSHKDLMICSNIIHNIQKAETAQISINWWMHKQNVVYLYNGLLFSHKKEWSTDICHKLDELWKYYIKWKKPVTLGHIVLFHNR
jgi:hypothetical protein